MALAFLRESVPGDGGGYRWKLERGVSVIHGEMIRDEREEWPDDVPVGSFDIHLGPVEGYPGVTGHMLFVCPFGRRCCVLIGQNALAPQGDQRLHVWAWDGNLVAPTLSPSLNCLSEKDGKPTGGCGWHGFITGGRFR